MPTMPPRKCVYCVSALRTIEQTGDSSPALRMTCSAISIGETCPSGLGTNCHPEEAARLTKDLLRHRFTPARPARVPTGKAARLPPEQNGSGGRFFDCAQNDRVSDHRPRNPSATRTSSTSRGSGQATTTPGRWSGHSCLLTYINPKPGNPVSGHATRRRRHPQWKKDGAIY